MNAILLATAIAVAAPGSNDAPKKEPAIVGMWVVERDPEEVKLGLIGPYSLTSHEFSADGKWTLHKNSVKSKPMVHEIKFDEKADPATFDATIISTRGKRTPALGIYKVDGDTLTFCFSTRGERPKSFEKTRDASQVLLVMKRKKKKE